MHTNHVLTMLLLFLLHVYQVENFYPYRDYLLNVYYTTLDNNIEK